MSDVKSRIKELDEEDVEILESLNTLKNERAQLNQLRLSRRKPHLKPDELRRVSEIKREISELGMDHQDLLRERAELRKSVLSDEEVFRKAAREILTGVQYDTLMARIRELVESDD